jgi:hypothetical protein
MEAQRPQYWIQCAAGSDPDHPKDAWRTTLSPAFESRVGAEAAVQLLRARHPLRARFPHVGFVPEVHAPSRWTRLPPRLRRLVRKPEFKTPGPDLWRMPEACIVPVDVVYRVLSKQDLRDQGEDTDSSIWKFTHANPFIRVYPNGESMTDQDLANFYTY